LEVQSIESKSSLTGSSERAHPTPYSISVGVYDAAPTLANASRVADRDGRGAEPSNSAATRPSGLIPVSGRGGTRRIKTAASDAVSLSAGVNLERAVWYALTVGLALNRFTTVHWERAGVADGAAATARFLKLMGDWIRSRGGVLAYVWVRETGPNKGEHVHLLIHLPPDLAPGLKRRQRGWLKACGANWKAGVIYSRPIGLSLRHAEREDVGVEGYEANLSEALDYVLKGGDAAMREGLGVRRSEPGGRLLGKRCGVSRNIGAAARARSRLGFVQTYYP